MLASNLGALLRSLPPIVRDAGICSSRQKQSYGFGVSLTYGLMQRSMTMLATDINLRACIKQQADDVNVTSNCRDMEWRAIKQTSRRDSCRLITESNKLRQISNLIQECLQIVRHTEVA